MIGTDHYWRDWTNPNTGLFCGIDFATAYTNGGRFAFLKACSGASETKFYREIKAQADSVGYLNAPYVWLYGGEDPGRQADFWYPRIKDSNLVAIDFENYNGDYPRGTQLWGAIERLRNNGYTGKIGVYTRAEYWRTYANNDNGWLNMVDFLWLADPDSLPSIPAPFTKYDFHQYSWLGDPRKWGGISGKEAVDENRYNGTIEELKNLFGAAEMPPEIGETMNAHNPNPLSLRNAPRVATETFITTMPANTQIVGTEIVTATDGGKWLKTTFPQAGYCASWLLVYDTAPPPPAAGLPTINMTFKAAGYPDKIVEWIPNA